MSQRSLWIVVAALCAVLAACSGAGGASDDILTDGDRSFRLIDTQFPATVRIQTGDSYDPTPPPASYGWVVLEFEPLDAESAAAGMLGLVMSHPSEELPALVDGTGLWYSAQSISDTNSPVTSSTLAFQAPAGAEGFELRFPGFQPLRLPDLRIP